MVVFAKALTGELRMDREQFWTLLEETRPLDNNPEAHSDALIRELAKRPPEEIMDFERVFTALIGEAYRRDLWSVAYRINGGCSDDGFDYFREWLIGKGREVFELG